MPGQLVNGTEVDIFRNGAPVSYDKPADVSLLYKNQRWQKYLMNLWLKNYSDYRLSYGKYLCRQWNNSHPANLQLKTFKILFMLEKTKLNYETPEVIPTTVWNHTCF